jgi:hypothetical protein
MTNQEFDRVLDSIRADVPAPEAAEAAAQRVGEKLTTGGLSPACAGFRADFEAFRAATLSDARRMLLEDHLHSCALCRREYSGAGARVV